MCHCQPHLDASTSDKKDGSFHFHGRTIGVVHLLSLLSPILPMPAMAKNVSPSTSLEFAFTPNSGRQITRCLWSKHSLELDPHGAVTWLPSHHNPTSAAHSVLSTQTLDCTSKTSLGIQASALTLPRYFIARLLKLLSLN